MSELWRRCLERLEGEFGAEDIHTYLKPLQSVEGDDGLRLLAPNAYTLERIEGGHEAEGTIWQQMTRHLAEERAKDKKEA